MACNSDGHVIGSPSPIEIFQVALILRLLEAEPQVLLHFRDVLEIIGNLKPLHIYGYGQMVMCDCEHADDYLGLFAQACDTC